MKKTLEKEHFVLGKVTFRSYYYEHFVLWIIDGYDLELHTVVFNNGSLVYKIIANNTKVYINYLADDKTWTLFTYD